MTVSCQNAEWLQLGQYQFTFCKNRRRLTFIPLYCA